MNGPPTRDLHSIYNAPMLGAHNRLERYGAFRAEVQAGRWGREEMEMLTCNHNVDTLMA